MKDERPFYITTPIYYPSNKFTLGNCYTTIACDTIARFNRMLGRDVFYLTGTDEHGQKIMKKAQDAGLSELEYLDAMINDAKNLWSILDISYDDFIRTTESRHEETVKYVINKLNEKGYIYKDNYKGWYCTPCESFWTEAQLVDHKCPDCHREVHEDEEEAYFFKLSLFTDRIINYYKENPNFLEPKSRVNEMINNFLKDGLKDLCISRSTVSWGIGLPMDETHTIYVWAEALINYISALGYGTTQDERFKKYWPCDVHVVGKEIVRFHSITWPAILMALDLPLPKQIVGHGWLLFGGEKLSKSKENITKEILDPRILCARYGSDPIRLYLTKEIPFGSDGIYTQDLFFKTYNSCLSNTIGNLVSRVLSMIEQYNDGFIPSPTIEEEIDKNYKEDILKLTNEVFENMSKYDISTTINKVLDMFNRSNKYIDETTPWVLAKDETKKNRLNTVLYNLSDVIIKSSTLLLPFITKQTKKIFEYFGIDIPNNFENILLFGSLPSGIKVAKGENLYARLNIEKENEELAKL